MVGDGGKGRGRRELESEWESKLRIASGEVAERKKGFHLLGYIPYIKRKGPVNMLILKLVRDALIVLKREEVHPTSDGPSDSLKRYEYHCSFWSGNEESPDASNYITPQSDGPTILRSHQTQHPSTGSPKFRRVRESSLNEGFVP